MTHASGKYADFEGLREKAVALRRAGYSLRQIRSELKIYNNDILNQLVKGEPPPAWTKRPNAKDDLRQKARELRLQGWTYDQIEAELGCSRSSVSLWVRDLPKPERRDPTEQAKLAARKRWEHELAIRDQQRQRTKEAATQEIGELSARDLFMAGVALYWAEGSKDKPYDRRENVLFVNSDAGVIRLYLAWLDLLGVERERLRYRVMIHMTADVEGAECYWADVVGADVSTFQKTTIKKHNPKTIRKNVGESYRGCLVIRVSQGAELYRRIEGWWHGMVSGITASVSSGKV
ncbi:terminase gpP N-terminus-related DNA-binding protein [Streptomyces sp. bgisy032]|uniref:terminase gpP N-terminus-related DNA-binding protein n=1 Tax=Streptomyces sp. bgisy032 TaxID=3413773 RepID=UPI003D74A9C5